MHEISRLKMLVYSYFDKIGEKYPTRHLSATKAVAALQHRYKLLTALETY